MKRARVHHAARRRGGCVAARGARAAGRAGAAHRRAPARSCGRCRNFKPASGRFCRGCSNRAGPSAATCGSTLVGPTANADDIRRHAAELVALAPDVILAHGASTVRPLLQATRTVPIVFPVAGDPVGAGFVDSLARPGGNATGFMTFEFSMSGKWLELLKEIAPGVTRAAVLRDPPCLRDQPVCRHPGRGAVAQGGGKPGQYARRWRDRARRSRPSRAPRMAA